MITRQIRKANGTIRVTGRFSEKVYARHLGHGRNNRINRRWRIERRARRVYDDRIRRNPQPKVVPSDWMLDADRKSRTG